MIQLKYRCTNIREQGDFEAADVRLKNKKQYSKSFSENTGRSWALYHDYIKPGKPLDGTIAIDMEIWAEADLSPEDTDLFAGLIFHALEATVGEGNVLSLACTNIDGFQCAAILYPLDGRRLNAARYMSKIKKDQPSDRIKTEIEKNLRARFPDVHLSSDASFDADKASMGYMPALINYRPSTYKKEYDTPIPYNTKDLDSQVQTDLPYDEVKRINDEVLTFFTRGPERLLFERSQRSDSEVTPDEFMRKVRAHISRYYENVGKKDALVLENRIYRAIFENYILEPLIEADEISDIMCLGPDNIRVKIGGERFTSNLHFIDGDDYLRFIYSLTVRNNLNTRDSAIHVFSDTHSSDKFRMRFNLTTPYVNSSEYPYLHIRKIAKQKRGMDYLLRNGMLDEDMATYLIDKARTGKGMIFTGKGASGKTSLMNALIDCIPFNRSGLVIQESEELFSDIHPHLMFEHITMNAGKGQIQYDLQDLARNGLLTDLDYFIIGEVKGAEAKYFINAADTGHKCWCSVHSPSSTDAIDKLADYVMYETKYSKEEATYMLKDLGLVIFMQNFKICEISEISGWDNVTKELTYEPIYKRPVMAA